MRLAICGTRTFDSTDIQDYIVSSWPLVLHVFGPVTRIYSGGANGVDEAAERVAKRLTGFKAVVYHARWSELGKLAGPVRNRQLAVEAHALLLIWNETSPGSRDVMGAFQRRHKPVLQLVLT